VEGPVDLRRALVGQRDRGQIQRIPAEQSELEASGAAESCGSGADLICRSWEEEEGEEEEVEEEERIPSCNGTGALFMGHGTTSIFFSLSSSSSSSSSSFLLLLLLPFLFFFFCFLLLLLVRRKP
jgi:hypothetical protein